MFWFGAKKAVDITKVKNFNDAIRAIKTYIYLQEWEKARDALDDITEKEKTAFAELEYKIKDDYKDLQKQRKIYEKTLSLLQKLEKDYEVKKIEYERKIENDRFLVRFKSIQAEIKKHYSTGQNNEALNILNHFLEENKDRTDVVTYYAKEKRRILDNIKKKQKKDKQKIQSNAELEAIQLAGLTLKNKHIKKEEKDAIKEEKRKNSLLYRIYDGLQFQKRLKERYEKKKLIDEVKILIEEESKAKEEIASKKLEHIHQGLIKELEKKNMIWFDIYGKILGSDKISGDSFWFTETKNKYTFYIGDATGHGVRAGLIISLLSKVFQEEAPKDDIINLTLTVNNKLKENLQSKNFVTGLFFEIDKWLKWAFNVSGMGHEPLYIYRAKTKTVEKVIAGWLAGGIRLIKNAEDIKPKTIEIGDKDVVLSYSDGVVESRGEDDKIYGLERLEKTFLQIAQSNIEVREIYNGLIEDLKLYKWGTSFTDDTTILLFRRNSLKDILTQESDEIAKIKAKEWLSSKEARRLTGKTKEELDAELIEIRKEKQVVHIIQILAGLYMTGEFLKLKQEATRYIKEWYIHKKINYYLKKAIENEEDYKLKQKNTKMENKYNVLVELLKKKDFNTVIQECNEILAKDGNI